MNSELANVSDNQMVSVRSLKIPKLQKLLKEYYPDGFDFNLTPVQAKKINKGLMKLVSGTGTSIPLICRGVECPYTSKCILYQNSIAPIGFDCPLERIYIDAHIKFYIEELNIEWDTSIIERGQVLRIIESDILSMRASNYLATKDWYFESVVGIDDETGKPITNPAIHPAFDLKERCQNIKSKILKELVATRESAAKVYDIKTKDSTTITAETIQKAENILKNELGDFS